MHAANSRNLLSWASVAKSEAMSLGSSRAVKIIRVARSVSMAAGGANQDGADTRASSIKTPSDGEVRCCVTPRCLLRWSKRPCVALICTCTTPPLSSICSPLTRTQDPIQEAHDRLAAEVVPILIEPGGGQPPLVQADSAPSSSWKWSDWVESKVFADMEEDSEFDIVSARA
jgi:hypothetical protein